ncbi:MAG: hypothetical protein C4302_07360, partial [Thermus sp.]
MAALLQHRPAWIALEPSSAYPLPLVTLLAQKGFQVALVNPYQVASFRRAAGERNKSDPKDTPGFTRSISSPTRLGSLKSSWGT